MDAYGSIRNEIKARLAKLGKSQKDLFTELNFRGVRINSIQQLYQYVNETITNTPKSETVISESRKILNDWERG
jgi:hypothetical protein